MDDLFEEVCKPGEPLVPGRRTKHGTPSAYVMGCRGASCREAQRKVINAQRERVRREFKEHLASMAGAATAA